MIDDDDDRWSMVDDDDGGDGDDDGDTLCPRWPCCCFQTLASRISASRCRKLKYT